jgi:putative transcriptional regulator
MSNKLNIIQAEEVIKMDGDKIRIQRAIKKMTQQELADKAHINRSYLSLIETGEKTPSLSLLSRIAKVLKCEVKDFF